MAVVALSFPSYKQQAMTVRVGLTGIWRFGESESKQACVVRTSQALEPPIPLWNPHSSPYKVLDPSDLGRAFPPALASVSLSARQGQ